MSQDTASKAYKVWRHFSYRYMLGPVPTDYDQVYLVQDLCQEFGAYYSFQQLCEILNFEED